jgi:hypothetical protein
MNGGAALPDNLGGWWGGGVADGDGTWSDQFEAKYATDGYIGANQ